MLEVALWTGWRLALAKSSESSDCCQGKSRKGVCREKASVLGKLSLKKWYCGLNKSENLFFGWQKVCVLPKKTGRLSDWAFLMKGIIPVRSTWRSNFEFEKWRTSWSDLNAHSCQRFSTSNKRIALWAVNKFHMGLSEAILVVVSVLEGTSSKKHTFNLHPCSC